jgi:hypothetical protein
LRSQKKVAYDTVYQKSKKVDGYGVFKRNIISLSKQGIRTLTASMAEKSSFLSLEKANSIAAKYLDKMSKKPENR